MSEAPQVLRKFLHEPRRLFFSPQRLHFFVAGILLPLTFFRKRSSQGLLVWGLVLSVFDLHCRHSQQGEALLSCMRQKNDGFVRYGFLQKNYLCYDNDVLHE